MAARSLKNSSTEQQQATDDQHHGGCAAMDTEGCRSTAALMQDDRAVIDRYDSGRQHEPTKQVRGPVGYENGGEQARRNVTDAFRKEIRPRTQFGAVWHAVCRGCG